MEDTRLDENPDEGSVYERALLAQFEEAARISAYTFASIFTDACCDGTVSVDDAMAVFNEFLARQPDIILRQIRKELESVAPSHSDDDEEKPLYFPDLNLSDSEEG
ncbi:MAG: hypothetical protein V1719_00900 [Patescibacteria group bacterium]